VSGTPFIAFATAGWRNGGKDRQRRKRELSRNWEGGREGGTTGSATYRGALGDIEGEGGPVGLDKELHGCERRKEDGPLDAQSLSGERREEGREGRMSGLKQGCLRRGRPSGHGASSSCLCVYI